MENINIKDIIPHRYPMLLVDRIVEIENRKRAVGIKCVTHNEPFFQGHFPDYPIMPGVLIVEAMAQTAAVMFLRAPELKGRLAFYTGIEEAKFRKQVVPGDVLRMEMETLKIKGNFIKLNGRALVDGQVACEGVFSFYLAERPSKAQIHPTASVHSTAVLGKDVYVGPYTIIGEHVCVGARTRLEAHIMVEKHTRIGEDCHIHFGSVIGSDAQDVKYGGETTWVVIGDRNEIREYVTINRSTGKDTVTQIGSDCMLMTNVHIGHNCHLGNKVIIANMTNLAGHTVVEDFATIGGMTGVHQFSRIGKGAMVGAYTRLPQDVPPFMLCEGNPAMIRGLNAIGFKRRGGSLAALREVKEIYKLMYRSNKNTSQALSEIKDMTLKSEEAQYLLQFLSVDSKRGFVKKSDDTEIEIE